MRILVVGLAVLAMAGCAAPPEPPPEYLLLDGECDPSQLELDVQYRPKDSGAGMLTSDVVVTNVSDVECHLQGYPTVGILSAETGKPIGVATGLDEPADLVPMPAGGVAYFLVEVIEPSTERPGCSPSATGGMSVTLPGRADDTAIVTTAPLRQYCDLPEFLTLRVSAFSVEPLEGHVVRPGRGG